MSTLQRYKHFHSVYSENNKFIPSHLNHYNTIYALKCYYSDISAQTFIRQEKLTPENQKMISPASKKNPIKSQLALKFDF